MKLLAMCFVMLGVICGQGSALAASPDQNAPSSSESSGNYPQCHFVDGYCRCGEDKIKLDFGNPPPGMSLAHASCVWRKDSNYLSGVFTYKGNWQAKGIIKREDDQIFGDRITFMPAAGMGEIRLLGNPAKDDSSRITMPSLIAKLKLPERSAHDSCWKADAVLIIKVYTVWIDETDYSGVYIDKFELSKLGSYRACARKRNR